MAKENNDNVQINKKSLVVLLILMAGFWLAWPFIQQELVEKPAPEISFMTIGGDEIHLSDLSQAPVLLFFWATWCEICKEQIPHVNKLAEGHQVISIAGDSGASEEVLKIAKKYNMDVTTLVNDQMGLLKNAYHVVGYPTIVIIDQDGMIRLVKVGYADFSEIKRLLSSLFS